MAYGKIIVSRMLQLPKDGMPTRNWSGHSINNEDGNFWMWSQTQLTPLL
jgi:hypothetical protein